MAYLNWQNFKTGVVKDVTDLGPGPANDFAWTELGTVELDPVKDCDPDGRPFDCGFLRFRYALPQAIMELVGLPGPNKTLLSPLNPPARGILIDGTAKNIAVHAGIKGPPRLQLLIRIYPGDAAPPYDLQHSLQLGRAASGIIWGRRIKFYGAFWDESPSLEPLFVDSDLWVSFVGCNPGEAGGREFVAAQTVVGQINNDEGFNPLEMTPPPATTGYVLGYGGSNAVHAFVQEQVAHAGVVLAHNELMGPQVDPPKPVPWFSAAEELHVSLVGGAGAGQIATVAVTWLQGGDYWGG